MNRCRFQPFVLLSVAFCIALAGCQSQEKTADTTPQHMHTSHLLVRAASVVLAQALIAKKQAGEKLPDDYQSKDFAVSVLESIRLQHPEVFMVTDAQEKAIAQGHFDDASNNKIVTDALDKLTKNHVALTTMNQYLADQFVNDKLSGIRLELAARMLSAQLKTAMMTGLQTAL